MLYSAAGGSASWLPLDARSFGNFLQGSGVCFPLGFFVMLAHARMFFAIGRGSLALPSWICSINGRGVGIILLLDFS